MSPQELARALADLLPSAVCSDVSILADADPDEARYPEEAAVVATAIVERRQEFHTGRRCARRALQKLEQPDVAIPQRPDRSPLWPQGVVGSLTHTTGFVAAAVALRRNVRSLGIDAEVNVALPVRVDDAVLTGREHIMVMGLALKQPEVAWDRLVFSAKESVYKAWAPLVGQWLEFGECTIALNLNNQTFTADLGNRALAGDIAAATGHWRHVGRHLLTTLVLL